MEPEPEPEPTPAPAPAPGQPLFELPPVLPEWEAAAAQFRSSWRAADAQLGTQWPGPRFAVATALMPVATPPAPEPGESRDSWERRGSRRELLWLGGLRHVDEEAHRDGDCLLAALATALGAAGIPGPVGVLARGPLDRQQLLRQLLDEALRVPAAARTAAMLHASADLRQPVSCPGSAEPATWLGRGHLCVLAFALGIEVGLVHMDQTDLNAWLPIALVRVYGSGQRRLLLGFQDGHFMPIGSV